MVTCLSSTWNEDICNLPPLFANSVSNAGNQSPLFGFPSKMFMRISAFASRRTCNSKHVSLHASEAMRVCIVSLRCELVSWRTSAFAHVYATSTSFGCTRLMDNVLGAGRNATHYQTVKMMSAQRHAGRGQNCM